MPMQKIAMADASREQLHYFARTVLNLSVQGRPSADNLRAMIVQAGHEGDMIEVEADIESVQPARAVEAPKGPESDRVRIIIHTDGSVGGKAPVQVGVNGHIISIKRGVEVAIPYPHYDRLRKATRTEYEWDEVQGLHSPREIPVYPFSVISGA